MSDITAPQYADGGGNFCCEQPRLECASVQSRGNGYETGNLDGHGGVRHDLGSSMHKVKH